jgi:CHAT domain-containing protein
LKGKDATKSTLREAFNSGQFDIIHYAGHAFFDPYRPENSGLICAHGEHFTSDDIRRSGNMPAIVFFNACEAGRLRRAKEDGDKVGTTIEDGHEQMRSTMGLAEAFLRNGIKHYIGTYWPVQDMAAAVFASRFYEKLLQGDTIGKAICRARSTVHAQGSGAAEKKEWANYLHYGHPNFTLRTLKNAAR